MTRYSFPRVKKDEIERLPIQMAVYVPSTEFEKPITSSKWNTRVRQTVNFLNRAFGGTTRVEGIGSWEDNGKTINERVYIVESFATSKDYRRDQLKLKSWLRTKRRAWKQYQLSFEWENDLFLITK